MHFLGIKWNNRSKIPSVTYKNDPQEPDERYYPIKNGDTLSIKIETKRYCTGFSLPVDYKKMPCQNNIRNISQEVSQCDSCRSKDSIFFLPINSLNYDQITQLKTRPYLNYINIFGNKIIKTGVTAKSRKFTRILEQGALATIFFTDTDGYIARIIEALISRSLQIRQAVNWDTKIKHLQNICTEKDAFCELEKIYKQILEMINDEYKNIIFNKPEFYFNLNYYSLNFQKLNKTIDIFSQFNFNDTIAGKIIGIYGEILFFEQNNQSIIGINTKGLKGFLLQVSREKSMTKIMHNPKKIQFVEKPYENLTLF